MDRMEIDERMKEKERIAKNLKVRHFQNAWRNVILRNAIKKNQETEKSIYSAIENNQLTEK